MTDDEVTRDVTAPDDVEGVGVAADDGVGPASDVGWPPSASRWVPGRAALPPAVGTFAGMPAPAAAVWMRATIAA